MTWQLKDWWGWLLRRWWLGLPLMVIGGLVGVALVRWVVPSAYWAESVFYVGFNADAVLRYPEDYKNWEMTQLDGFVTSAQVLQAVLDALPDDPYWQDWTTDDLASHLKPRWFNAGEWHLHASADTPQHATLLAAVWGEVALEQIQQAIHQGEVFLQAERRWQMLEARRQAAEAAVARLKVAQQALEAWVQRLESGSAGEVTAADRVEMAYWASFAEFPEGGEAAPLPPPDASPEDYAAWGRTVARQLNAAAQVWDAEIREIEAEQTEVAATREQARQFSAGISAEWEVALAAGIPGNAALQAQEPGFWANLAAGAGAVQPQAHAVYTWKDGAVVGAFLGMLLWMALALLAAMWRGSAAFTVEAADA